MPEPTLALTKDDLEGAIGLYLGYGAGTPNGGPAWTAETQRVVTVLRKSGERQFYYPAIEGQLYSWSFLRPVATLTLASGVSIMVMPDDFGGMEGEITASSPTSRLWETVPLTGDVRPLYARNPTLTGRPRLATVEPIKGTTPLAGQRSQLYVWPVADADYTLQFSYYVNPDAMTGILPYALGGSQHAETLLAAVHAAAELYLDDVREERREYFQERLQASVNADKKLKPQLLGYNRDRSDYREDDYWHRSRNWQGFPTITYH